MTKRLFSGRSRRTRSFEVPAVLSKIAAEAAKTSTSPAPRRRVSSRLLALTGALSAIAITSLPGAGAQAAVIATNACNGAALTQPFLPWGDATSYELVPGGDFEGSLSGWTLSGDAHIVAGGEPYAVDGTVGSSSLSLPAGATAQTPLVCVNAAYPTFRFFGRNDSLLSSVLVQVVYRTPLGVTVTVPVGVVALSTDWQPTLPMLTASAVEGALSGGTAEIALRFTALTGTAQIDDVYVDPRLK